RLDLPLPASGDRRHGQGAGPDPARGPGAGERRPGPDGEDRPRLLAADQGQRHRGLGLPARLEHVLRRTTPDRHHAVPAAQLIPEGPMIRSRLVVTKQTPLAPRGMVVAEHWRGADVGAAILARGGNAVDAAVATAVAMTVVEPFMSTIAGSGTMLVHLAKRGETIALNFNGVAPLAAHESIYKVVGGVSDGLFSWPRTEGSAIELAREGFETDWYLSQNHAKFMEELQAFPVTARNYLRDGRWTPRPAGMLPGDRSIYPDLARSLELIAKDGPDAFYRGAIGQALVDDMAANGGLIRRQDLEAYRVIVEPALSVRYRDVDLAFSPGSTGGPTAAEMLNILAEFPSARVGWQTVEGLHLRASAIARAFRDRFEHLGDPAVIKAPWERLLSRA